MAVSGGERGRKVRQAGASSCISFCNQKGKTSDEEGRAALIWWYWVCDWKKVGENLRKGRGLMGDVWSWGERKKGKSCVKISSKKGEEITFPGIVFCKFGKKWMSFSVEGA